MSQLSRSSTLYGAIFAPIFIAMLLLNGCDRDAGHDEDDEDARRPTADHTEAPHATDSVVMDAGRAEQSGIKTATAGPGNLTISLTLPGEVSLDPDRVANVCSPISGTVLEVLKRIGDEVRVGEPVMVIDSGELAKAKSEYLSRSKAIELAKLDLRRANMLRDNTLRLIEALKKTPELEALTQLDVVETGAVGGELLAAYTEYVSARDAHQRQQALAKEKLSTEADIQMARSAFQKALAVYVAARDQLLYDTQRAVDERSRAIDVATLDQSASARQLQILGLKMQQIDAIAYQPTESLSRLEMVSPIAGRIVHRQAFVGQVLKDDATPLVVADVHHLLVRLTVFQQDIGRVHQGAKVTVTLVNGEAEYEGQIAYLTPSMSNETRSAVAVVPIAIVDDQAFQPGAFVTGHVALVSMDVPILVPRTSLQTVEGRTCVFVKTDEGFQAQTVTVGRANPTHVEIKSGLDVGTPYVKTGSFVLKAELGKSGMDDDD